MLKNGFDRLLENYRDQLQLMLRESVIDLTAAQVITASRVTTHQECSSVARSRPTRCGQGYSAEARVMQHHRSSKYHRVHRTAADGLEEMENSRR
jgi:hypothetical protein